jgi:hypothetical protein
MTIFARTLVPPRLVSPNSPPILFGVSRDLEEPLLLPLVECAPAIDWQRHSRD